MHAAPAKIATYLLALDNRTIVVTQPRADKGSFVIHVTGSWIWIWIWIRMDVSVLHIQERPQRGLAAEFQKEATLHQIQVAGIEIEGPFFYFVTKVRWSGS
ncbi:unnamed protein product [Clonostachys solani]|uniref:Uncharacterized protein n=1 Tax=Clonostachys solani TaxID=160281 RepID=A0A9N9ZNN8_9HYPO|nr:unnamed protein product [Clonostachys solani]